jgi:hypothetical protein
VAGRELYRIRHFVDAMLMDRVLGLESQLKGTGAVLEEWQASPLEFSCRATHVDTLQCIAFWSMEIAAAKRHGGYIAVHDTARPLFS